MATFLAIWLVSQRSTRSELALVVSLGDASVPKVRRNWATGLRLLSCGKKTKCCTQGSIILLGHVSYPLPPPPPTDREHMKQGSNTIMSTWFALKFWSNEIIDVDIIQPFTLIQLKVAHFNLCRNFAMK